MRHSVSVSTLGLPLLWSLIGAGLLHIGRQILLKLLQHDDIRSPPDEDLIVVIAAISEMVYLVLDPPQS